jgi:hypothetical protein
MQIPSFCLAGITGVTGFTGATGSTGQTGAPSIHLVYMPSVMTWQLFSQWLHGMR